MHSLDFSLPPLDCLQAAIVAQQTGSFSAAAEHLNLTHATISRRVAVVENWCNFSLFDRKARGVTPTLEGQRLLTRIGKMLRDMDGLLDRKSSLRTSQTVRILTTPSFARFWMLPRLKQFEEEGIGIDLITSIDVKELNKSGADLAIRFGVGGWDSIFEICTQQITYRPVIATKFADKWASRSSDALKNIPLLHNADSTLWHSWGKRQSIPLREKRSDRILGDYGLTLDAAQEGLGAALWMQELHTLPEGLCCLDLAGQVLPQGYTLIRPNKEMSEPTIRLMEKLTKEMMAS